MDIETYVPIVYTYNHGEIIQIEQLRLLLNETAELTLHLGHETQSIFYL